MMMFPSIYYEWRLSAEALARSGLKAALELSEARLDSAHKFDERLLLRLRKHVKPLPLRGVQAHKQFVHDARTGVGNLDQQHAPIRGVRHASDVIQLFEDVESFGHPAARDQHVVSNW